MDSNSLVSIVTPVYNSERYLPEAIESVLGQTYADFEYLLIDDASLDRSKDIILDYANKDSRIKYQCLTVNGGAAKARNAALNKAKGQYVAFLDSDDIWMAKKLEKQIKQFRMRESLGIVGTNGYSIHGFKSDSKLIFDKTKARDGKISIKEFVLNGLPIATSSVTVKRECFKRCGYFKEQYSIVEDYLMWLNICRYYEICIMEEPLIYYRFHDLNISRNKIKNRQAKLNLFENEIISSQEIMEELGNPFLFKLQRMYCSLGKMYSKNGQTKEASDQFIKALNYKINPLITLKTYIYRMLNALEWL